MRLGFSLFELIIVITLLGIISTIIVPNLNKQLPQQKRKEFVESLNMIVQSAWQNAFIYQVVYRVKFSFKTRTVIFEQEYLNDGSEDKLYKQVNYSYGKNSYVWPDIFEIKQMYIQGVDEIGRHGSDREIDDIWFFVMPDGLTQEVVINFYDLQLGVNDDGAMYEFGLVLNPFTAEFDSYDKFQTPSPL